MDANGVNISIDKELIEAIMIAVRKAGQPESVADRLIAWLDELARGGSSIENKEDTTSYFRSIIDAIAEGD